MLVPVKVAEPSEADSAPVADHVICHTPATKASVFEVTRVPPDDASAER